MHHSDNSAIHLFVNNKCEKSIGQNVIGDKSAGVMIHNGTLLNFVHKILYYR